MTRASTTPSSFQSPPHIVSTDGDDDDDDNDDDDDDDDDDEVMIKTLVMKPDEIMIKKRKTVET